MIVTRPIALRIALIVLAAVIVQAALLSQMTMFGSVPNMLPVVVVSLGLLGGGVVGAVCGFATGFLSDSLLLQTLGVSSLVLLSIGYLAGRYRESFEIKDASTAPLLAAGFTLLATTGFAALQLMLGVESAVSLLVLREILVQSLLAIPLAFALYPLIRRVLAPALIDYAPTPAPARRAWLSRLPLPRRRRARRARSSRLATTHGEDRVRRPGARRRRSSVRGGVA